MHIDVKLSQVVLLEASEGESCVDLSICSLLSARIPVLLQDLEHAIDTGRKQCSALLPRTFGCRCVMKVFSFPELLRCRIGEP